MKEAWTLTRTLRWTFCLIASSLLPRFKLSEISSGGWHRIRSLVLQKRQGLAHPQGCLPRALRNVEKSMQLEMREQNAKKAEELADVRAGGKGSGVWSDEELEDIRKTGKFPIDTRWHHDPTVANRPDLAADPKVVHPLRGGTKGHLWDGHGGNFQDPKK